MNFSKPTFVLEINKDVPGLGLRLQVYPNVNTDHASVDGVECLVIGQVYLDGKRAFVGDIMRRMAECGPAKLAEEMDGSFFLVWLDFLNRKAYAISDITASRKIFTSNNGSRFALSDSPAGLNLSSIEADPIGLVEYLLNGIPIQNRTAISGVSLFPRSSIGELDLPTPRYTSYWNYEFDDAFAGREELSLIKEFGGILEQATRMRAAAATSPVAVSLSGGYDSTCILGSLLGCKAKDEILAFSYASNPAESNTDAAVANATCRRLGIEHRILPIPKLQFHKIIDLNARRGFGAANLCGEIGVWEAMPDSLCADGFRPTCFFGDNAFGHDPNWRVSNVNEMLAWLPLAGGEFFNGIEQIIQPAHRDALRAGFVASLSALLAQAAKVGDVTRQRDYLYFDQRVTGALMPWRDFFCGLHLDPVNPLLDKNILNFFSHLHYPARKARNLYKKTVRWMFPDLLASRRAVFYGSAPGVGTLMRDDTESLDKRAKNLSEPLGQYIQSEALSALLKKITALPSSEEGLIRRIAKFCLKGNALTERVRSFSARKFQVDLSSVVARVLVIDRTLRFLSEGRHSAED